MPDSCGAKLTKSGANNQRLRVGSRKAGYGAYRCIQQRALSSTKGQSHGWDTS